jgi:hypothetical protein
MQSISGKTARSKALQQQLTAYKQRHSAKDVRLSKAGTPLPEDELKAQLLTVMERYGKFVPPQQPQPLPSTTSTPTDAAPALASAAAATPLRAKAKHTTTARRQSKARKEANPQSAAAAAAANDSTRVLQCCGAADNASSGDQCVQCDCCTQWFHCACEQVAWEAANSMEVYLCRMCLGELAPAE